MSKSISNSSQASRFGKSYDLVHLLELSRKYKMMFISSIFYGLIFILGLFLLIYGAIGLSYYLPKYYDSIKLGGDSVDRSASMAAGSTGQTFGGWVAILACGVSFLVLNLIIPTINMFRVVLPSYNDFSYILKKSDQKSISHRTIQAFLTVDKKGSLIIYVYNVIYSWFIAFKIYVGLETTYNASMKKSTSNKEESKK